LNLERTLETQRVKLLRLVTGWLAVVVLVSGGSLGLPRWARSFLADLIVRAEFAAQCLVLVSARLQTNERWAVAEDSPASVSRSEGGGAVDETPSVAVLLRRMKALRRVLQDLPRFGRRLLRPLRGSEGEKRVRCSTGRTHPIDVAPAPPEWVAPRVERPPDKGSLRFSAVPSELSDLFRGANSAVSLLARAKSSEAQTLLVAA